MAPVVMVSNDEVIVSGTVVGRVEDLIARTSTSTFPRWRRSCASMKKQFEDLHALANDGDGLQGRREHPGQQGRAVPDHQAGDVQLRHGGGYGNINFAVLRGTTGEGGQKTASNP